MSAASDLILPQESPPSTLRWVLLKLPGVFILALYLGTYPSCMWHWLLPWGSVFHTVVYHLLLAITLVYWFATTLTDPGRVPMSFYEACARREVNPRFVTFCRKCQAPRPDRAHHSSWEGRCVLKLDHNCPWVARTVGFRNYKCFLLYLLATTAVTGYVGCMQVLRLVRVGPNTPAGRYTQHCVNTLNLGWWKCIPYRLQDAKEASTLGADFGVLIVIVICFSFTVGTIFLGYYHWVQLASRNVTTIEDGITPNPFDLGSAKKNLLQIFGDDWRYWFLPVVSAKGDGVTFPVRKKKFK